MIQKLIYLSLPLILIAHYENFSWAKNVKLNPGEVVLSADEVTSGSLPRNWRVCTDSFLTITDTGSLPSREGLDVLKISGSGEFTEKQLQNVKAKLSTVNLTVIDLRQEPHGYLNGEPITWYANQNSINLGKLNPEIEADEEKRLKSLSHKKISVTTWSKDSKPRINQVSVVSTQTEKSVVEKAGASYLRLPVPDHRRPDDVIVDLLIAKYRSISNEWIHFHCAAGKGRTTTAMVLFDMLRNANRLSETDILRRQQLLGGADLLEVYADSSREKWAKQRIEFIHKFYRYARSQSPHFSKSWTQWLKTESGQRTPTAE